MEIENLFYDLDDSQSEAIVGGAGIGQPLSNYAIGDGRDISKDLGYQNLNKAIRDGAITAGDGDIKNQGGLVTFAVSEFK